MTSPPHYDLDPTPYSVITAWGLNFTFGNIIKYVARYSISGNLVDLKKAQTYLNWAVHEAEGKESGV